MAQKNPWQSISLNQIPTNHSKPHNSICSQKQVKKFLSQLRQRVRIPKLGYDFHRHVNQRPSRRSSPRTNDWRHRELSVARHCDWNRSVMDRRVSAFHSTLWKRVEGRIRDWLGSKPRRTWISPSQRRARPPVSYLMDETSPLSKQLKQSKISHQFEQTPAHRRKILARRIRSVNAFMLCNYFNTIKSLINQASKWRHPKGGVTKLQSSH